MYSSNSNHSPQVIKEVDRAVHHGLAGQVSGTGEVNVLKKQGTFGQPAP